MHVDPKLYNKCPSPFTIGHFWKKMEWNKKGLPIVYGIGKCNMECFLKQWQVKKVET
jgi:hypothetical protein